MGDAGDAFPLLGGRRGHERARCCKENVVDIMLLQLRQEMPAEHACGAAAARAARMGILILRIEDQRAAVLVNGGNIHALLRKQIAEELAADDAQIAGNNGVEVAGGRARGRQMPEYGVGGGGGNCQGWTMRLKNVRSKYKNFVRYIDIS